MAKESRPGVDRLAVSVYHGFELDLTIQKEAFRRQNWNRPNRKGRQDGSSLNPQSHIIGLAGEAEFARVFGLNLDLTPRRQGDGGRDFSLTTTLGDFHVDVKTATHLPPWLLVPYDLLHIDSIYVLASFRPSGAKLHGWQWGKRVRQGERGDFAHTGVDNYRLLEKDLRPMIDLLLAKV